MIDLEELADARVPNTPKIPWYCVDVSDTTSPIPRRTSSSPIASRRSFNTSPGSPAPRHEHEKWKGLGNRPRCFGQGQLATNEKTYELAMKDKEIAMKDKDIELAKLKLEIVKTINEGDNNHKTEASLRQMQRDETIAQMNLEQNTVRAKPKENPNGEENQTERNKDQELTQLHFEIENTKLDIEALVRKREHDIEFGKQQSEVEILKMQNYENARKREHDYNMKKLEYDHYLAIKTKALEIIKCRAEIEKEKSKRHSRQTNDYCEARKHKEKMAELKQRGMEVLEEIQRMSCVESERSRMLLQQTKQDSEPATGNAANVWNPGNCCFCRCSSHFLVTCAAITGLQK